MQLASLRDCSLGRSKTGAVGAVRTPQQVAADRAANIAARDWHRVRQAAAVAQ